MRWLLVLLASYAAAQTALPLLPTGVTIDMVKQIQVSIPGTLQFIQSTDGSSTIASRLAVFPTISYDNMTGILYVQSPIVSGASMLQPGMLAAVLSVLLWALDSKHNTWLLLLGASLGVASAGFVVTDVTIRVPGCWHTEGTNGMTLVFDDTCSPTNLSTYQALTLPQPTVSASYEWTPITPATSFLPANDHGMHYINPLDQYEVWRATYGLAADNSSLQNFLLFTERCMAQNRDPDRNWTAGCNQFSNMAKQDWVAQILANNAQLIANAGARRRLLGEEYAFSDISETQRRKLLQSTDFSWVGSGRLTPVKDQGQCGSCYAHATSSQMEAALAIATQTQAVALSREQLKDCSSGSPGCNGGAPSQMFVYSQAGLGTEAAYPYVASQATCKASLPASAYKDSGNTAISNNELAFKAALANGPVAVTVCADTWDNYAGGVFTNCASGCNVDHAVLLVGYGTDATLGDYWLIQNSWNTWWGESGFIRLPNTHSSTAGVGMCGLTTWPGYQAKSPVNPAATGTACQGSWSAWSTCSKTCGGGTQTKTWTTTTAASGGGAACPSPTTQSQTCNTNICPTPSTPTTKTPTRAPTVPTPTTAKPTAKPTAAPVPTTTPPTPSFPPTSQCIYAQNSVLGSNAAGNYQKAANWNAGTWCGTAATSLPQYQYTNVNAETYALYFYATNCMTTNGVARVTAGQWGLGTPALQTQSSAYQWSSSVTVTNGVIPTPDTAGGWTLQFAVCH